MTHLCFEENEDLNKTEYTQAAMLTACTSILKAVEKEGVVADITAGLSLGEYSALVANGVFTFEDAVKIVRKRGEYMVNEVASNVGTMAAILGLETDKIETICREVSFESGKSVELANYNCPGQIVISGEKETVLKACEKLKEAGAKRTIELNVSGPFHSSMLKGAGDKLAKALEEVNLNPMKLPYINNVSAELVQDNQMIKKMLEKQVYSPVKWQQSIELMIQCGVETFVEIGPGKTLSGFLKKIDKTIKVINIEKYTDLEKLKEI